MYAVSGTFDSHTLYVPYGKSFIVQFPYASVTALYNLLLSGLFFDTSWAVNSAPARFCFSVESVFSRYFVISILFLFTLSFDVTICFVYSSVCAAGSCATVYTFSSIKYPSGAFVSFT